MSLTRLRIDEHDIDTRLDVFLFGAIPELSSRSMAKKLIDGGHVKVNETVVKAHHKVTLGEEVLVDIPKNFCTPQYLEPENIPLNIFYEDDYLLIIHKPQGLVVHPTPTQFKGTLVNALLHYSNQLSSVNEDMRPGIVHRLDKETSGLLIVAKDNITHTKLAKQFQRHTVKKKYIALVEGDVEFDEGVVNVPLGRHTYHRDKRGVKFDDSGKEAKTFYRVLKRQAGVSLVALFPRTGRTHQLRVHMAYLKHPILGDDKYGQKSSFSRLALHASAIGFVHPATRAYIEYSCPAPASFFQRVS